MSNVIDFGADPTGQHDSLPAFRAAIDFLAPHPLPSVNVPTAYGGRIDVPQGEYKLCGSLSINRSIRLVGETGSGRFPSSILKFETGGIEIESANAELHNPRGDNSILENLGIYGAEEPNVHGVHMKARAILLHCRVRKFGGSGIFIDASEDNNCNVWQLSDVLTENNGEHGLYVEGEDSNAGWCIGLDAQNNGGYGIFDSSHLGNTYIACHTSANLEAAYRVGITGTRCGSTNRTILLGCYSERGQPASIVEHPCLVIGGDHGAGFGPPRVGGSPALRIHDRGHVTGFKVLNEDINGGSSRTIETSLGLPHDGRTAIRIKLDGDTHELLFQQRDAWLVCFWASHGRSAFAISGRGADRGVADPSTGSEIPVPEGSFKMERGYYIGRNSTMKYVGVAAKAADLPTDVDAQVGDRVYNTQPTPGGFIGWVYTSEGWKGFGKIEI